MNTSSYQILFYILFYAMSQKEIILIYKQEYEKEEEQEKKKYKRKVSHRFQEHSVASPLWLYEDDNDGSVAPDGSVRLHGSYMTTPLWIHNNFVLTRWQLSDFFENDLWQLQNLSDVAPRFPCIFLSTTAR